MEASRRALKSAGRERVRLESACSRWCPEMWIGTVPLGFRSGRKVEVRLMMRWMSRGSAEVASVLDSYSCAENTFHRKRKLMKHLLQIFTGLQFLN